MKFDNHNMAEIKQYFPNLELNSGNIRGEIEFSAQYIQNHRKQWIIEPCEPMQDHCVYGKYQVKIAPNNPSTPKVFETGGKIKSLAQKLGMQSFDLHLNVDDSCCLDYLLNFPEQLSASAFILHKVYPFFVWQAYYDKFHTPPPVGEYSHGRRAAFHEFYKDLKNLKRNDRCICGSGKKFKKCCEVSLLQVST
uniref:SEC-C motif-containing protein n=1 Tax=uncultured Thiotrichaceae bacterium TaxID=298394 RepID=A0A6S6UI26_9GAMM|nr:MAG: Unknown protein [uncultured Thiotrichaceae bacterium]